MTYGCPVNLILFKLFKFSPYAVRRNLFNYPSSDVVIAVREVYVCCLEEHKVSYTRIKFLVLRNYNPRPPTFYRATTNRKLVKISPTRLLFDIWEHHEILNPRFTHKP